MKDDESNPIREPKDYKRVVSEKFGKWRQKWRTGSSWKTVKTIACLRYAIRKRVPNIDGKLFVLVKGSDLIQSELSPSRVTARLTNLMISRLAGVYKMLFTTTAKTVSCEKWAEGEEEARSILFSMGSRYSGASQINAQEKTPPFGGEAQHNNGHSTFNR